MSQLKDEIAIDKLITTPIVDDNHFFDKKLKDEISGNDYKEVLNQSARKWLLKGGKRTNFLQGKNLTLNDANKGYEVEHENRAPGKLKDKKLIANKLGEIQASGRKGKSKERWGYKDRQ